MDRIKADLSEGPVAPVYDTYPEVPVVRVVLDNLNTHRTASLYETFPAVEAGGLRNGWSSTTRPSTAVG